MHDGRMIVENNYYHALTYCEQQLTTSHDSMIVGLQIFIEKKEMALDSNFWCGCPVKTGILLGEKVLFGVYISKRVVQKMDSWLPHDIY